MSKVTTLDAALAAAVRPRMSVHLTTHARAATRALQRVLHGKDVQLTLIMARVGGGHAADLVASGLIRHVIAGSYGAVSRHYTGPLRQVQQVFAKGAVTFQHWSFYSLAQRLIAGASGLPFVPTHSLAGTGMARDNAGDYIEIDDPFGGAGRTGLVRAVRPDLSIVHAIAADEDGNTLMVPPLEDGAWGPRACREGAIVTCEHIVDRAFIRRHSHLVRLPARYVRAVCALPFGAHPGVFGSHLFPEFNNYAEDEAFNQAYFEAVRSPQALARWVDEWIMQPASHQDYLQRLGPARIEALCARPAPAQVPVQEPPAAAGPGAPDLAFNETELLMTLALRQVVERSLAAPHDVLLVGVGLSEVPGTAARTLLRERGHTVTLAMGHGFFGFEPFPGHSEPDPSTTLMLTDNADIYGVVLGGRKGSTLAILGVAQIDRYGNLNSTLIDGQLLTGSGGSNDAASTCDCLVVTRSSRRRLVEQVEYVTAPGTRVRALITERGVFEKDPASGRMLLTVVAGPPDKTDAQLLEELAARCAWPLEVSPTLTRAAPPATRELQLVRWLMPSRYA